MKLKFCPNCGRNPPRTEDAVMCQQCYDSVPFTQRDDIERVFKALVAGDEGKPPMKYLNDLFDEYERERMDQLDKEKKDV
jgi:hypothetical protein